MSKTHIDGLPIYNAITPLTINVTKTDVNKADIKKPDSCAVARACRRQLHIQEVHVHLGRVYVKATDHWLRYETPKDMRSEIIAFDRGGTFVPGKFTLKPIRRSAQLSAGRQQGSKTNQTMPKSKEKKRRSPQVVRDVRASAS